MPEKNVQTGLIRIRMNWLQTTPVATADISGRLGLILLSLLLVACSGGTSQDESYVIGFSQCIARHYRIQCPEYHRH